MKTGKSFWRNQPPFYEERGGTLVVRTGKDTDYWNNTFYGFKHANGHFRATEVTGDFSLEVTFSANYQRLYDQAGAIPVTPNATGGLNIFRGGFRLALDKH